MSSNTPKGWKRRLAGRMAILTRSLPRTRRLKEKFRKKLLHPIPKVNPGTEMSKTHEDEDSDWDAVTSVMDIRAENVVIQERLSQMENVMQHMMQTLLQIQQQQSQSKV